MFSDNRVRSAEHIHQVCLPSVLVTAARREAQAAQEQVQQLWEALV